MKRKYDWSFIQAEYNSGKSQSQLYATYGVSPRAILLAIKRVEFISRNKSDAGNLHNLTKVPHKHSEEFKVTQRDRIIARYVGENPNGSRNLIAGITNERGNVVGLMPHPEHAIDSLTGPSTDGLPFFTSVLTALVGK